jgi:hypothetical protein
MMTAAAMAAMTPAVVGKITAAREGVEMMEAEAKTSERKCAERCAALRTFFIACKMLKNRVH